MLLLGLGIRGLSGCAAPPDAVPTVSMRTSLGVIEIELYPAAAPRTVGRGHRGNRQGRRRRGRRHEDGLVRAGRSPMQDDCRSSPQAQRHALFDRQNAVLCE